MASPQCEDGFVRVATEVWDALCRIRIPGEVRQVVDVVIRKTWGYQKKRDWISIGQFQKATGINRGNVSRALRRAIKMNLIVKNDDPPVKNDDPLAVSYSFNKDYDEWTGVVKKDGGRQKGCDPIVKKDAKVSSKKTNTIDIKDTLTKDSNVEKDKIPYSEIISDLNLKAGRNFKLNDDSHRGHIRARWRKGYRLADFIHVNNVKVADNEEGKFDGLYVRPATLYNGEKMAQYVGQPETDRSKIVQEKADAFRKLQLLPFDFVDREENPTRAIKFEDRCYYQTTEEGEMKSMNLIAFRGLFEKPHKIETVEKGAKAE